MDAPEVEAARPCGVRTEGSRAVEHVRRCRAPREAPPQPSAWMRRRWRWGDRASVRSRDWEAEWTTERLCGEEEARRGGRKADTILVDT